MTTQEEFVTVCAGCGFEIENVSYSMGNGGWDGNSYCPNCEIIEPDTEEITLEEYENA